MPLLTPKTYKIAPIKIHTNVKCIKTRKFMFNKNKHFLGYVNLLKESLTAQTTKAVSLTE